MTSLWLVPAAAAALMLSGCKRDQVEVYKVSKDSPPPADGMQTDATRAPLSWTLPSGWTEQPAGQMRVASFSVAVSGGKKADVSVVPLGGPAGGVAANVNRWRSQVGQPPLSEEDLKKASQPVELAGQPAELYEAVGKAPDTGEPWRIVGAIQSRDGTTWFFKMAGNDDLVADQKSAFIGFLKSITFQAPGAANLPPSHPAIDMPAISAQRPPAAGSTDAKPAWQVPAGWREISAGDFLVAKFMLGDAGSQAAVNVSTSAGDGGGFAANVNRWRQQLGLGPMSDADISKAATTLDTGNGKATLVDLSGTDARTGQAARLVGVVVPEQGQTWFYKLMGDPKIVDHEKDAFTGFVKSARY